MDEFLGQLSPSIRFNVLVNQFSKIIGKLEVFNQDHSLLEDIVRKLQVLMFFPEDEVIKQGDEGQHLYFLERG